MLSCSWTCLASKGLTETNGRRYTDQHPGTNSARGPADKPLVNRGFCSSGDLHRISFVHASEETFMTGIFDALEGTRDACLQGERICLRLVLPCPPHPAAPPCATGPDPPFVCPGFGMCNSTNLTDPREYSSAHKKTETAFPSNCLTGQCCQLQPEKHQARQEQHKNRAGQEFSRDGHASHRFQ